MNKLKKNILINGLDYDSGEYSEKDHRVLTDNDRQNKNFEEAVKLILQMKNPRIYKMAFGEEQSFDMIYAISVYGIASIADERISRCILRKYTSKDGKNIDNYEGLNEKEKIEKFFNHFEKQKGALSSSLLFFLIRKLC